MPYARLIRFEVYLYRLNTETLLSNRQTLAQKKFSLCMTEGLGLDVKR
jgi:hypothetical protein